MDIAKSDTERNLAIEQGVTLFLEHRINDASLGRISEELSYRTKDRAQQLHKEILGVLEGRIPRIRPPRAASPEDQSEMFHE